MMRSALLSDCGRYRYLLGRRWTSIQENPRHVVWVMLNPSSANAEVDDPTIRRCIAFSRRWGYGSLVVVNLFAYRTHHPPKLAIVDDPVGPDNDEHIARQVFAAFTRRSDVVAAWGANQLAIERAEKLLALCYRPLQCLGMTKSGAPRHPLYVRGDTNLREYAG